MKQVTITTLSGSSPYNIYLCDSSYNNCIYIANVVDSEIPYSFIVPINYSVLSQIGVKVLDSNGCEIKDIVTL